MPKAKPMKRGANKPRNFEDIAVEAGLKKGGPLTHEEIVALSKKNQGTVGAMDILRRRRELEEQRKNFKSLSDSDEMKKKKK